MIVLMLLACFGSSDEPAEAPEATPTEVPATPDATPPVGVAPPAPGAPDGGMPNAENPAGAVAPVGAVPAPNAAEAAPATIPTAAPPTTPAAPAGAATTPAGATTTPTAATPAATPAAEPAAAPAVAKTYDLSPSNSTVYVQVYKDPDTAAAGLSHDHVILAKGWSGSLRWHPTDASQCKIDVTVPVRQLDADPPSMRRAVGYEGDLDEGQRADVKKNMLDADQLNASAHPNITFSSTSCDGTSGTVNVTGKLTIRGKSKTVTVPLKVDAGGGFTASGSFKVNHTDFGFEPYSAMMGALKNRNQMKFTIQIKAQ